MLAALGTGGRQATACIDGRGPQHAALFEASLRENLLFGR